MKNKNIKFITVLAIVLALSFSAIPASAQTVASKHATSSAVRGGVKSRLQTRATSSQSTSNGTSTVVSAKTSKAIATAITKADTEITNRIDSLNKTLEKVQGMKNVSASDKSSITSDLQSEITKLQALKSKIDSDTDLPTIKKDLATITAGSRIYALVIPRANILASVDKVNTIATMFGTISTKLQSRISEVKASSTDASSTAPAQDALDSIIKKVADAKNEALTAQVTVSSLAPDNGDKTKLDSNNTDIKSAKANIKTANQDLSDARRLASSITNWLKDPSAPFVMVSTKSSATSTEKKATAPKVNKAKATKKK